MSKALLCQARLALRAAWPRLLAFGLLATLGTSLQANAQQPNAIGTRVVDGSYQAQALTAKGGFKQYRVQASSSGSNREWNFMVGTNDFSSNWRPYDNPSTTKLVGFNQFIDPGTREASARYNGGNGTPGLLPDVTASRYYTFNITNKTAVSNDMAVLETTFSPVTIGAPSVPSPAPGYGQPATITATLGAAPGSGENFFLRYTSDAFTTSGVVQMTVSGTTASGTIPAQTGTSINYYVFSSSESLTQINSDFTAYARQSVYDMATLNLSTTSNYTVGGLRGTYTVNPAGGELPNFPTMTAAFSALNGRGVAGPVVLSVKDGANFSESNLNLIAPAGTSSTNTITFQRDNSGTARPSVQPPSTAAPGQQDAVIKLQGADYVTFDGIDVGENSSIAASDLTAGDNRAMEYGYALFRNSATDGCQHNSIRNANITLNLNNGNVTYGVYLAPTAINGSMVSASNLAGTNSYNSVLGNNITTARTGIYAAGAGTNDDSNVLGNIVGLQQGNTITGSSSFGLLVFNESNVTIGSNDISFASTNTSNLYGIVVGSNTPGAVVARNRVVTLKYAGAGSVGVRGISLDPGNITANIAVRNNVVADLTGGGNGASNVTQLMGIGVLSGAGYTIYNNSVQLNGDRVNNSYSDKVSAALFVASGASGIDLRNNVLSNVQTTSDPDAGQMGTNYAVYAQAATGTPFTTIDYNLYDLRSGSLTRTTAASAQYLGRLAGADISTLAAWQTATGQDRSSMLSAGANTAAFTSATSLMPNANDASSYVLNGTGVQIAAVDADIVGNSRPTTVAAGAPDLGAYEFTPIAPAPNPLDVSGAPAPGGSQTFSLNGRPLATITYGLGGTVPGSVVGRYYPGFNAPLPYSASARFANTYFTFADAAGTGSGYTYTLALSYDPALLGTISSESQQAISQRLADNSGYQTYTTAVNTTARTLTTPATATRLGLVGISDVAAPLPVTLVSFRGRRTAATAVQLSWQTAAELNNAGFYLERQAGAGAWQALAFVPGAGSSLGHAYAYLDAQAPAGQLYYRLRQTDFDGSPSYSPVVAVAAAGPAEAALRLSPVPTPADQATLAVDLSTLPPAARTLAIYDLQGRLVLQATAPAEATTTALPVAALAAGTYLVQVQSGGSTYRARFSKL